MALPTPDGVVALDLDLSTLPDEAGIYWLQRETGALPDNHLLVQLMRSAMLGSIGRPPTSDELPTLLAWQRQLMSLASPMLQRLDLLSLGAVGVPLTQSLESCVHTR